MRQNRLFIPMRIGLTALAMIFMAIVSPKAAQEIIFAASAIEKPELDPIVTGQTISPELIDDWKAKKAKYDECGLCEDAQPYPEDLPEGTDN